MNSQRMMPDIQYIDTDPEKLINLLITGYEKIVNKKLYPADPMRLFILWIADILIKQRLLIDHSAKQNLPRFAEGEFLDELVAFLNEKTKRLPAQAARTRLKYTLSIKRGTATTIPAGTRVTVDGEINFRTTRDLIILPNELEGEVEAICDKVGEIGNGFKPGQIKEPIDIFPYFESVENITETAGGADRESDDSLYNRNRESLGTYSTAGPEGAYKFYAKSANPTISDVEVTSPSPGIAEIRVLLKDGKIPGEEILQSIKEILSDKTIRPLTDKVEVKAPEIVNYNIDITYYTLEGNHLSAAEAENAANQAIEEYIMWQSEKMGRDINPDQLNFLLIKAGIKRVEIREPAFMQIEDIAVAVLENKNIINGGQENE